MIWKYRIKDYYYSIGERPLTSMPWTKMKMSYDTEYLEIILDNKD